MPKRLINRTAALSVGLLLALAPFGLTPEAHAYKASAPVMAAEQKRLVTSFYYEAAIQVAGQGALEQSLDLIGKAYRVNRADMEAGVLYAQMLQSQGHMRESLDIYREMIPNFPDPKDTATLYYFISLTHDSLNQYEEAIRAMKEAIRTYPGKPPVEFYYDIGVFYSKLNRFDQTRDYSKMALEAAPDSPAAWNNLGYSLARLGRYQEGYEAIRQSLALDPENPNALDSMGYVLYHLGRFQESIMEYERALEKDPKLADSLLYLGKSYEATQAWPKAIAAYERFLAVSDNAEEKALVEQKLKELQINEFLRIQMMTPATDVKAAPGPQATRQDPASTAQNLSDNGAPLITDPSR